MRSRISVAACSIALLAALAACTHAGPAGHGKTAALGQSGSNGAPVDDSFGPHTPTPSPSSTRPSGTHSTGTTKHPSTSGHSGKSVGARLDPPIGYKPSGVICNYVSRSDVNALLPGTSAGQENDLNVVAVSYCAFSSSPFGTVTVGVKNMNASGASTVREKYNVIAGEPGQSVHTFTAGGAFAFGASSTTPLKNGEKLYALNTQGSRGNWYVTIQYYAHRPCSTSAMQHLLSTVLSKVP